VARLASNVTFFYCIVAFRTDDSAMHRLMQLVDNLQCSGAVYLCRPTCSKTLIDCLRSKASITVICSTENMGYGRAINILSQLAPKETTHLIISNADITIDSDFILRLTSELDKYGYADLLGPSITAPDGSPCYLCKRDPTLLALLIRFAHLDRLIPWARVYNTNYTMQYNSYNEPMECTYLSGCFMIARLSSFEEVGGFDERYFLYLEDADITRTLAKCGKAMYTPNLAVMHGWGRGPHKSLRLALINVHSYILYSFKWGFRLL